MRNIPTKNTGDPLTADEFNDIPAELESSITSTGIALSAGDLTQLSKAIANYAGNGDFYTDSGSGTAYVLTVISSNAETPAYADGQQIRFIAANTNTSTAPTVAVGSLGGITITDTAGAAIRVGDIQSGEVVTLSYDSVSTKFFLSLEARNFTASSGFAAMPGGLIVQWGSTAAIATGTAVAFDISFTTLFAINVTGKNEAANLSVVATSSETVSGFTLNHDTGDANAEFFYIALGI